MPTFEEIAEAAAPLAAATEPELPSLDALDSLTLDVPPLPDFSNWTLDTDLALDLPEPTFTTPPLERLAASESSKLQDPSSKVQNEAPKELELGAWSLELGASESDPVIKELEGWLAAVVADRSRPR